jgi:uncharacterized metal-binding protein YceD (DUF177 family)
MITMPLDEHEIDLVSFFYEYIHLALPIKRIHPDDEKGNSTCNPEMIRKLNDHLIQVRVKPIRDGMTLKN